MTVVAYRRSAAFLPESGPMKGSDSGSRSAAGQEDSAAAEHAMAASLVARIRAEDRAAEEALVARYSRGLLFMLKRRCQDLQLAEDLHQEVFCIVIERLRERGIDDPTKLAGFIQNTGRNLLIGRIRRRQRRQTYADSDAIEAAGDDNYTSQEAGTHAAQLGEIVRRMLAELSSDRDRAILTRFYLHQEDKAVICAALDLTDLHFNRVLYRAKKRFRALIEASDTALARALIDGHIEE